jgi:hypothetical protein
MKPASFCERDTYGDVMLPMNPIEKRPRPRYRDLKSCKNAARLHGWVHHRLHPFATD